MDSGLTISGASIGPQIENAVSGPAVVLTEPLCFLAVNPNSGMIEDRFHPQNGHSVRGAILALPGSRGGAATPDQLCETIRAGAGPAAIVLPVSDPALAIGAVVADLLYGIKIPVGVVDSETYASIRNGEAVSVSVD